MKWYHYLIFGLIIFIAGLTLGYFWFSPYLKPVNDYIQTNQGNVLPMPAMATVTNGVTNWITVTNIVNLYNDDLHWNTDPFVGIQNNNMFKISLYQRSAIFQLKPWYFEKRWMIGITEDYSFKENSFYMGEMLGYQWSWGGGIIHASQIYAGAMVFIRL